MNLFRFAGWMLLLYGAGFFVGEVFMLPVFLAGWTLIAFNPVHSNTPLVNHRKGS